jgi:hypothetical protein
LNRRLANDSNTIAAAKVARSEMNNLYAIELGNEPNCMPPVEMSFFVLSIIGRKIDITA